MSDSPVQRKKILMACIQPYWSCLQLGSQHLARQFARHGYEVHYFSAPVTPLHLLKIQQPEVRQRFQAAVQGRHTDTASGIHSYIPLALLAPDGRPGLRGRLVTVNWQKTLLPPLDTLLRRHGLDKVDILYIDNLSYHFLPQRVRHRKSLFRVMDRHDQFPGWLGYTNHMARSLAAQADLTIYSACSLRPYVQRLGPRKMALVTNGVDFDFFQRVRPAARPALLSNIPDPMVLYSGSLDKRLDLHLIRQAARRLPEIAFVFAGPLSSGIDVVHLPSNVVCLGPVPHAELPVLMQWAKAGLIPFDLRRQFELIQGMRSLKLLEYMAAGLPVISARWPEVENMGSPTWFYNDPTEFVTLVQQAVMQPHASAPYREYARRHDWASTFKLIRQVLT